MVKKILSSFLIMFLFNTAYIPYIPPRDIVRKRKIEYIFDKDDDLDKDFIFLKDRTIVIIYSKLIPLKINKIIFSKN